MKDPLQTSVGDTLKVIRGSYCEGNASRNDESVCGAVRDKSTPLNFFTYAKSSRSDHLGFSDTGIRLMRNR
jgi:hypothetical protein